MARLVGALLLVRDVARSAAFYGPEGVGLTLHHLSPHLARLGATQQQAGDNAAPAMEVTLQAAAEGSESALCTGYTPMLTFEVAEVAEAVPRLLQLGAHLDGAIKHAPHGKVACVRSPDGHMLGLYEPAV